ncbi:MATE family efflux transporter [Ruminococcus gauvreauii]|uniref:MATE family efflux transporter n=1 Tax=Ruminococcus gauvreauii TaxID=438033 RepID=UPI0039845364
MNRVKDMTSGNPTTLLLLFALPLILGNLGQQLYMIVDAIIVGQGVGVKALAAVGATDWTYWLVLWTIQALTQGFGACIAKHFGEKDHVKLRKSIAMSIILCVGIGIFLTLTALLMVLPMLKILQTPADIFDGASSYLFTMFSGTLIVMAYNMISAILRAFGDGKTPLIAMGIAAGTNIALDLLFVMVFRWGIAGAAAATLIAQLIAFLYCFLALRHIEFIRLQPSDWKADKMVIRELCRMGFPLALQHVLIAVGGMILQSRINIQGFIFVAGFTATNKLYGLLESAAISLGYATTTYMAQNHGAGQGDRIRKGLKSVTLITLLMSVCSAVPAILGGKHLLKLFISSSDGSAPEVLAVAYQYLVIMGGLLFILYFLHGFRSTLQGLGDAVSPMISGVIEFFMRISAALLLTEFWGSIMLFLAEPLAWIGAAAYVMGACWFRFRKIPPEQKTDADQITENKGAAPTS